MKINIIGLAPKWIFCFNVFTLLAFSPCSGQEFSRTYTKELKVSPETILRIKGPTASWFSGSGTLSTRNAREGYFERVGRSTSITLIKDFQIYTWDKPVVKQVVEVTVQPLDDRPPVALFDALQMKLQENAAGILDVRGNMNIKSWGYKNGFFVKDRMIAYLMDGSSYDFKKLTIKASVYIPRSNNVELQVNYLHVSLGDLDGALKLFLLRGELDAGHIGDVRAKLESAKLRLKQANHVDLVAKAALFEAEEVHTLDIQYGHGVHFVPDRDMFGRYDAKKQVGYSLSKYIIGRIERIKIDATVNDQFTIKDIDQLDVKSSKFSNYFIRQLQERADFNCTSGDVTIQQLSAGFADLSFNNQTSTITVGTANTENYLVEMNENTFTEFVPPSSLQELSSDRPTQQRYLNGSHGEAGTIRFTCENCKISLK